MDKEGLINLLEPAVNALGYELIDLDVRVGRNGLLRMFIDKDPAVTLDDCERVSRHIGDLLDVEDPIVSNYVLEVSSPGSDRRLRTRGHFEAVVGQDISVELQQAVQGRKRFKGRLNGLDEAELRMEVDGTLWQLPLSSVRTAKLVPTD
jgi:ribosome maturation factor RimP